MDEDLKKPKTIQMKYPAPYSQSWTENETTIITNRKKSKVHPNHAASHTDSRTNEKITRRSKRKAPSSPGLALTGNTPVVYPLPFTKTTANTKTARPKKPSTIHPRISHKINSAPFTGGPWQPQRPKVRGPDPTAPHLKYGLFSQKKSENKSQMQVLTATGKENPPKSRTSTAEHSSKKDKRTKAKKGNTNSQQPDDAPMFVFRAIDPRYTRQLSVSAPTHVDIKPRTKIPANVLALPSAEGRTSSSLKNKYSPTQTFSPQKKSFPTLVKKNVSQI